MENIDCFSTVEIRTAYIAINRDSSLDSSLVRRHIYTEIIKFVKKGWLKKLVSNKKGITRFVKTDLFYLQEFMTLPKPTVTDGTTSINKPNPMNVPDCLLSRLNDYKSALLEGLGEAEEYKILRLQFPKMHESLLDKYNEVRERNTRLLGKIKAIENLMAQQK